MKLHFHCTIIAKSSQAFLCIFCHHIKSLLFNGQALVNSYGEPFDAPVSLYWKKPLKEEKGIIGQIFKINEVEFLFFGINENIVSLLLKQNHSEIIEYKVVAERFSVSAEVQVPIDQPSEDKMESIVVKGVVHQNSAGLVIGVLKYSNN